MDMKINSEGSSGLLSVRRISEDSEKLENATMLCNDNTDKDNLQVV
jgi:hypothetical protein